MRVVESLEDTTLCNGKYAIPKGARVAISAAKCQTDPKIWGEDVRSLRVAYRLGREGTQSGDGYRHANSSPRGCTGRTSRSSRYVTIRLCGIDDSTDLSG